MPLKPEIGRANVCNWVVSRLSDLMTNADSGIGAGIWLRFGKFLSYTTKFCFILLDEMHALIQKPTRSPSSHRRRATAPRLSHPRVRSRAGPRAGRWVDGGAAGDVYRLAGGDAVCGDSGGAGRDEPGRRLSAAAA